MKKAIQLNDIDKKMLGDNIKKAELFRFMKKLHQQSDSPKARQKRITNDLLRRYFAQRMTQICGVVR